MECARYGFRIDRKTSIGCFTKNGRDMVVIEDIGLDGNLIGFPLSLLKLMQLSLSVLLNSGYLGRLREDRPFWEKIVCRAPKINNQSAKLIQEGILSPICELVFLTQVALRPISSNNDQQRCSCSRENSRRFTKEIKLYNGPFIDVFGPSFVT